MAFTLVMSQYIILLHSEVKKINKNIEEIEEILSDVDSDDDDEEILYIDNGKAFIEKETVTEKDKKFKETMKKLEEN